MTADIVGLPPSCAPASALDDETLVDVALQTWARAVMHTSESMHSRAHECRTELLRRLSAYAASDRIKTENLERLQADAARMKREVALLRRAGGALSNCAFNLAQRNAGDFGPADIEALAASRLAWDAAKEISRDAAMSAETSGPQSA